MSDDIPFHHVLVYGIARYYDLLTSRWHSSAATSAAPEVRRREVLQLVNEWRSFAVRLLAATRYVHLDGFRNLELAAELHRKKQRSLAFDELLRTSMVSLDETFRSTRLLEQPKFDLPTAIDVLSEGNYSRLPSAIRHVLATGLPLKPVEKENENEEEQEEEKVGQPASQFDLVMRSSRMKEDSIKEKCLSKLNDLLREKLVADVPDSFVGAPSAPMGSRLQNSSGFSVGRLANGSVTLRDGVWNLFAIQLTLKIPPVYFPVHVDANGEPLPNHVDWTQVVLDQIPTEAPELQWYLLRLKINVAPRLQSHLPSFDSPSPSSSPSKPSSCDFVVDPLLQETLLSQLNQRLMLQHQDSTALNEVYTLLQRFCLELAMDLVESEARSLVLHSRRFELLSPSASRRRRPSQERQVKIGYWKNSYAVHFKIEPADSLSEVDADPFLPNNNASAMNVDEDDAKSFPNRRKRKVNEIEASESKSSLVSGAPPTSAVDASGTHFVVRIRHSPPLSFRPRNDNDNNEEDEKMEEAEDEPEKSLRLSSVSVAEVVQDTLRRRTKALLLSLHEALQQLLPLSTLTRTLASFTASFPTSLCTSPPLRPITTTFLLICESTFSPCLV